MSMITEVKRRSSVDGGRLSSRSFALIWTYKGFSEDGEFDSAFNLNSTLSESRPCASPNENDIVTICSKL